jgi:hypothetical protein
MPPFHFPFSLLPLEDEPWRAVPTREGEAPPEPKFPPPLGRRALRARDDIKGLIQNIMSWRGVCDDAIQGPRGRPSRNHACGYRIVQALRLVFSTRSIQTVSRRFAPSIAFQPLQGIEHSTKGRGKRTTERTAVDHCPGGAMNPALQWISGRQRCEALYRGGKLDEK